jgi:hypothetical protein
MIKNGNDFVKPKQVNYTELINVWVEDTKRIEMVKRFLITDKNFKLEKLKTNPVYNTVYTEITLERDRELEKLDKSLLWSRKFTKQKFYRSAIPFSIYSFVLIPYIFYKVLQKRILEMHIKREYNAENLKSYDYWNLDFENKDIYPDSVIKKYFEIKKKKQMIEEEQTKALAYSDTFVENISKGYLTNFSSRRKLLGFEDDEI